MSRDSIHVVLVFLNLGLALVSIFLAVRVVLLLQDTSRTLDYLAGQIKKVDAGKHTAPAPVYQNTQSYFQTDTQIYGAKASSETRKH